MTELLQRVRFGVVVDRKLELAPNVHRLCHAFGLTTAEALVAYARSNPVGVALGLCWTEEEVLEAATDLEKSLKPPPEVECGNCRGTGFLCYACGPKEVAGVIEGWTKG